MLVSTTELLGAWIRWSSSNLLKPVYPLTMKPFLLGGSYQPNPST